MSTPSIAYPSSLKMARSPIFYTGKNNTLTNDELDAMSLNLKIWSGTSAPTDNNYELSKSYSIGEVINFEVSDLIRSEFSHDFSVYDASFYEQSPINEALWVNATEIGLIRIMVLRPQPPRGLPLRQISSWLLKGGQINSTQQTPQ
jgi:hypothetical protein